VIFLDETFARKLQEESTEECSSSSSNSYIVRYNKKKKSIILSQLMRYFNLYLQGEFTFSAVLTKKLLLEKFKHINSTHVLNVLRAKNYKFHVIKHTYNIMNLNLKIKIFPRKQMNF